MYRMIKPKVMCLIFVSGKIVLTGAKVGAILFRCSDINWLIQAFIATSHLPDARRDIHRFQHDLHCTRIPQTLSVLRHRDTLSIPISCRAAPGMNHAHSFLGHPFLVVWVIGGHACDVVDYVSVSCADVGTFGTFSCS